VRTTIDGAGRLVVPKVIRDRFGLLGGAQVDIVERDGVIEIVPVPVEVIIVDGPHGAVAVSVEDLPPLTDAQLRSAIDDQRR